MAENKIVYGLRNVHYSVISESGGVRSFAKPKKLPGAVNLSLSPSGEKSEFYADDIPYFVLTANAGYEGDLEIMNITDDFMTEVMGEVKDKNGVYFENADAIAKNIALLFEFQGDVKQGRNLFYNCTVARANIENSTKQKSIEPKTLKLSITCAPDPETKLTKAKVYSDNEAVYKTFFDDVYKYVTPTV